MLTFARMRLISLAALALACGGAFAQAPGPGETRPALPSDEPPARSEEPAVKSEKAPKPAADSDRALARCQELSGAARDECLDKERSSAAGASRAPEPPTAPPPQNPR